ncbi:GntR family transcriptional regulator [Microbacterium croceum]|uniref:GntR family transcriptional regulator n=1 Tax=Microbacterium croceum TaxID=2851645 RepID=UPI001FFDE7F0|nr:GntR family transcriptional regulator [Microbacterium croceum]
MTSADAVVLESTKVAGRLRDAILDGIRSPGSRLIERDLAAEFGVSRVPVRDALKILEAEGLVTLRPRTWAIVREFTDSDMTDLDEVRSVLEPLAFRLAAERHRPDGLEKLRRALDEQTISAAAGDPVAARRAANDFHEQVTVLAENRLLSDLMQGMRSTLRWGLAQHDDLADITEQHRVLFQAISERDGDRVEALALEHIDSSRRAREAHLHASRSAGSSSAVHEGSSGRL